MIDLARSRAGLVSLRISQTRPRIVVSSRARRTFGPSPSERLALSRGPESCYSTSHAKDTLNQSQRENSDAYRSNSGNSSGPGVIMRDIKAIGGAAVTALVGIGIVFIGGIIYVEWYKEDVLKKVEEAFTSGRDPMLELANSPSRIGDETLKDEDFRISHGSRGNFEQNEQADVDRIMRGRVTERYALIVGPKGSGKHTMILNGIRKMNGEGVVICEAHPDLEVFRLRLGKALHYEYNEDSQAGLFQRRDPHEGGPRLSIERALNTLEKVALRRSKPIKRPLVIVFNKIHLLGSGEEGKLMLQQLQQKAEKWAETGIITTIFISYLSDMAGHISNRMHTIMVQDLSPTEARKACQQMREDVLRKRPMKEVLSSETIADVASISGGRLAHMSRLMRSKHSDRAIHYLKKGEKAWLLNNTGLIPDCDDDIMDEQKWSSCTWLLLREFVRRREKMEKEAAERREANPDGPDDPIPMPSIPYHECRRIMTRHEFINQLDHLNIISIDIWSNDVRPDSMITLEAAREVVNAEGFNELLEGVRNRLKVLERLRRTREHVCQDMKEGEFIKSAAEGSVSG